MPSILYNKDTDMRETTSEVKKHMLEILKALQQCWANKERAVLATIVDVDGSAYRREGARCLVLESGSVVGTISGGCVEGDLLEYARQVIDTGIPREIRYDFRSEGDLFWGLGVGCNGALTIWLQPFDPLHRPGQAQQLIQEFEQRRSTLEEYRSGLVLESKDPTRVPVGSHLILNRRNAGSADPFHIFSGLTHHTVNGVSVKLFVETVKPRPRLVIFGAGPDAVPLVEGAKRLHWHVTVADHRRDYLDQELFAAADKRVLTSRNHNSQISVMNEAYVVVMTHNYELDRMLVQSLLPAAIPYLGVLGSRNRIERMLNDIRWECGELNEDELSKLHSPVGLDIGADSPEEIALSILSELVCRKNVRSGQSLRLRKEPLHERQAAEGLLVVNI